MCRIFADMKNRTYRMSITKIIYPILFLWILTSCASEYQIQGSSSVSRLDGKMLFVKVPQGDGLVKVDSAEVIHGFFRMQGVIDTAMIASLYMDDQSIMPLVMEKGDIEILIDNARIQVKGTPLNEKLYDFVAKKSSLDDRAYEVERLESRLIMDGQPMEMVEKEVRMEREKLSKEMDELVMTFIQDNYENVLGPGVFLMVCNGFPYPLLTPLMEEIIEKAPDSFKNHELIKEYINAARENMKAMNK